MTGIPSQFALLTDFMNETATRHAVASNNIANVNTPGFKSKDVTFGEALTDAGVRAGVIQVKSGGVERLDGNTVDIDNEIGSLKKVAIKHSTYTQLLALKIRQMRSAMSDR